MDPIGILDGTIGMDIIIGTAGIIGDGMDFMTRTLAGVMAGE